MLTYLKYTDTRVLSSILYERLETYPYDPKKMNSKMTYNNFIVDCHLVYIVMQILVINAPERAKNSKIIRDISSFLEFKTENFYLPYIDAIADDLYKEIAKVALECNFQTNTEPEYIFGNLVKLSIENIKVIVYTKSNYQYQSEGYETQNKYKDLLGIFKMRHRMFNALGIKTVQIQQGEWMSKSFIEKKNFLKVLIAS